MAEIAKYYNRLGLEPVSADPSSPEQGELQYSDGTHREEGVWRFDGSDWTRVGGSTAGINYLEDAESASSWTDDTNFTISENTTDPLRDPRDLLLSKAAVDASTETVSVPFSVDDADLAKVLPVKFEYKSDANYADGDYEIEIYDVTNAAVISNSAPEILANELGNSHTTYFQTAPDSNSYELRIKVVTTDTAASSLQIDRLRCGPIESAASQTIVSDWVDFTPSWTNDTAISFTTNIARYARNGQDMLLWLQVEAGGTGTDSGALELAVPAGLSIIDGNVDSSASAYPGGQFFDTSFSAGSGRFQSIQWFPASDTSISLITENKAPISGNEVAVGDRISLMLRIPIVGWESGTKPNEVISGREISAKYKAPSGQVIANGSSDIIDFSTVDFDTTASVTTGSSWEFVAPESGTYDVSARVRGSMGAGGLDEGDFVLLTVFKNGSADTQLDFFEGPTSPTNDIIITLTGSTLIKLEKGDSINIELENSQDTGANSFTVNGGTTANYISIHKLNSLSSQISPTETVAAIYVANSGQSIPNAIDTTILFDDKEVDTHNSYDTSTGVFTAPISGIYKIDAIFRLASTAVSAGQVKYCTILKNGNNVSRTVDESNGTNGSESRSVVSSFSTHLMAGDTIEIQFYQNYGVTSSLNTAVNDNRMSIVKIGN